MKFAYGAIFIDVQDAVLRVQWRFFMTAANLWRRMFANLVRRKEDGGRSRGYEMDEPRRVQMKSPALYLSGGARLRRPAARSVLAGTGAVS
ncbi:hypothetical protein QZM22_28535 [Burkholderia oklahomensis]|uniref:hypothetical protein n=1 Tax=Burkholderia oklahomensis TaxID=342113 RepID=UPI002650C2B8|nr:hypothetical protein [Burkholderia oklahomensis]MDN7676337.1 hypothetical protein [Burkholderia oklahomensis]